MIPSPMNLSRVPIWPKITSIIPSKYSLRRWTMDSGGRVSESWVNLRISEKRMVTLRLSPSSFRGVSESRIFSITWCDTYLAKLVFRRALSCSPFVISLIASESTPNSSSVTRSACASRLPAPISLTVPQRWSSDMVTRFDRKNAIRIAKIREAASP